MVRSSASAMRCAFSALRCAFDGHAFLRLELALLLLDHGILVAPDRQLALILLGRAHDGAEDHFRPGAVAEPIEAEGAGTGELALLLDQTLAHEPRAAKQEQDRRQAAIDDGAIELQASEQRHQCLRLDLQALTLFRRELAAVGCMMGRRQRHGRQVVIAEMDDHVLEQSRSCGG